MVERDMKLGLGTAQFGFNYGITNRRGQVPLEEVSHILDLAQQEGVAVIDTAAGYGNSEEVLGKCLPKSHRFQIVTKTRRFNKETISPADAKDMAADFYRSLEKLRQKSIYGLLVHHPDDLLAENSCWLIEALNDFKRQKLVRKIGVSVYSADQIDDLLNRMEIDLIQLPISVLDQRLLMSGHLKKLKQKGVEIHARSIFLQGILLKQPVELGPYFDSAKNLLEEVHSYLKMKNITPLEGALKFVIAQKEIDCVIVGVASQGEFAEIQGAFKRPSAFELDYKRFACSDEKIVNPSYWKDS